MAVTNPVERVELEPAQLADLLSYARQHHMSVQQALKEAVHALTKPIHGPSVTPPFVAGSEQIASPYETGQPNGTQNDVAPILPAGFVSRHPGRDYSSFGSATGIFGDGLAYQRALREQW